MPKSHNNKGRSKNDGQYLKLHYYLVQHGAFRSLNPSSVKVLLELRTRYNGSNNGQLFMSLDEGAAILNMSKSTVQRAFDELEHKGFIVKTKVGNWYKRSATEWRITFLPTKTGPPTNDFQNRWKVSAKKNLGTHLPKNTP